jgi:hypothetical protein
LRRRGLLRRPLRPRRRRLVVIILSPSSLKQTPFPHHRRHRISPPPGICIFLDPRPPQPASASPPVKQPQMLQIQYITGTLTSGAGSANSSSPRIRLQATSATTDDKFLHNTWSSDVLFTTGSVVRRPTFNRRTARSPSGCMHLWCPCDPRRRTRRRQRHGCVCVYPVSGPACNLVFFRGLLCNMDA